MPPWEGALEIDQRGRILGAPTPSFVRPEAPTSGLGPRANRENTVEGSSQGSGYPGHDSTQPHRVSQKDAATWPNAASCACRGQANPARNVCPHRPRIEFSDADLVRQRVEAHACRLRLRGARRQVLAAVLALLCNWSRITDDRVGLTQLVELIAAGGGRRYDLKTIGRALAGLAAENLIVYRPAQGRGRRAFIAIHDRFVGDIEVLERDHAGRVITDYSGRHDNGSVTFSPRSPYINQSPNLPTLRNQSRRRATRPTGVDVSSQELREVLAGLPEPMAALPKHLRWLLGREIRQRLQAGWRPDQILEVLSAPMPADVQRPWRLALWRLRHNIVGAGPRLRPLQQAWDAQAAAEAKAAADDTTARWYSDVAAVTSADERAELLRAHEAHFGRRPTDPVAALAGAGRRAARLFPAMPLAAALARWVADVLADQHGSGGAAQVGDAAALDTDLLIDLAIGGCQCIVCGSRQALARPQLPLKSMVCDQCWPVIAADLGADDAGAVAGVAA